VKLVEEKIEVSVDIEERLKGIAEKKGGGIEYMQVAIQCINVIHIIHTQWRAGHNITQETEPLFLPCPASLRLAKMHEIRLHIYANEAQSFQDVCDKYRIDKQSALSWAMDCMQIIDDTLMTARIFIGPDTHRVQLGVSWLQRKVGS
jgi:hypothetical protein